MSNNNTTYYYRRRKPGKVINQFTLNGKTYSIRCFNPLYTGHKRIRRTTAGGTSASFNPLYTGHKP